MQQQNANAYVHWNFGHSERNVWAFEQRIWVAQKAPATQWAVVWKCTNDPAHGGYLALQTNDTRQGKALFSLWNADAACGHQCAKFGGEGTGYSCRRPVTIHTDRFYRLQVSRISSDHEGQWWEACIIEEVPLTLTDPKKFYLGKIRVRKTYNLIRANSIENFSEYYGRAFQKCCKVPLSVACFTPPTAKCDNNETKSDSNVHSKPAGGSDPNSNPCKDGNQSSGAIFKIEDYNFSFTKGALVFLGGEREKYKLPSTPPLIAS